jgi:hypothetical protein
VSNLLYLEACSFFSIEGNKFPESSVTDVLTSVSDCKNPSDIRP